MELKEVVKSISNIEKQKKTLGKRKPDVFVRAKISQFPALRTVEASLRKSFPRHKFSLSPSKSTSDKEFTYENALVEAMQIAVAIAVFVKRMV